MCVHGQVEFERLERKKQARKKEKKKGMGWDVDHVGVQRGGNGWGRPWANGCPESVAHSSGLE
jgi:hypothetical protein